LGANGPNRSRGKERRCVTAYLLEYLNQFLPCERNSKRRNAERLKFLMNFAFAYEARRALRSKQGWDCLVESH
jgi:hypothetical protein